MQGIVIDDFIGDDRKAFLIYISEVKCEASRIQGYTNHALYIEATVPRLPEPNYESWLIRIFHPGINSHVTIGMLLIPREFLYNAKYEAVCLEKVFKTLLKEFEGMQVGKIVLSTKRNIHFLARIEKVISQKVQANVKVKSKSNFIHTKTVFLSQSSVTHSTFISLFF